jgi:hypothetical protein
MKESHEIIWPTFEVCYIHAMLFNTESALTSVDIVSAVMDQLNQNPDEDPYSFVDVKSFLDHAQNIIVQGAAISRYFWPIRKAHEARGELLRNIFEMVEDNPLKDRDLRNSIEHFDEKLDLYLSNGIVGYFFPEYFGHKLSLDGVPSHVFRVYFTDTGSLCLLGKEYLLQPLADDIYRIHEMLLTFDKNGGRLFKAPDTSIPNHPTQKA